MEPGQRRSPVPDNSVITALIEQRFDLHVEAAYQGKQYLVEVKDLKNPYDPYAGGMMTPVCNLSAGEIGTNHLGQSCGATHCKFEGVCAVCGSPNCPFWLAGLRATALGICPRPANWTAPGRGEPSSRRPSLPRKVCFSSGWRKITFISGLGAMASSATGSSLVSDWWTEVGKWESLAPGTV